LVATAFSPAVRQHRADDAGDLADDHAQAHDDDDVDVEYDHCDVDPG
jgi:hypothetical protein